MTEEKHEKLKETSVLSNTEERILSFYLRILRRRIWIIGTVFLIVFTIGTFRAFRSPKIYQAVCKVLVERAAPRLVDIEGVRQDPNSWDPEFYQTKADLVRSRIVMEYALEDPEVAKIFMPAEVVDSDAGGEIKRTMLAVLGGSPAPPPRAWEMVKSKVIAQYINETHFILIKVESTVPRHTATIANAVAKAYERYHFQLQVEMHGDTFEFLKREKDREEAALKKAEDDLQEYRKKAKTVEMTGDEEEVAPIIKRINELNDELTKTQLLRVDLVSQQKVIREITSNTQLSPDARDKRLFTVPAIMSDKNSLRSHKDYIDARNMVVELSETYGQSHPQLKAARASVALTSQAFSDTLDRVILGIDTSLKTLKDKEDELELQYEKSKVEALKFSKESLELTRLKNQIARHREMYEALTRKMLQVDVSKAGIKTTVQLVDSASIPLAPIRPNKKRAMSFSAFLGLLLGLGLAFLAENLDDVIKIPEDLRHRVGVSVLGFVPKIEEVDEDGQDVNPGFTMVDKPMSSAAEAYRNIRTSLFFSVPADKSRIIGIASCGPGEGKTTSAVNLAMAVALSGRSVLLIDADLHRPMVDKVFGLNRDIGLSNILIGEASLQETIQKVDNKTSDLSNLDVLTAGLETPNPAELLGAKSMNELLDWVRAEYDWVIIDTPPVLFVSDASIVSTLCDGVVLVVKSGKHNRVVLNRAIEHLRDIKINIIGSVLNMMVASKFGQHYTSYGHYGYSKYSRDYHGTYYDRGDKDESSKEKQ